MSKDIGVMEMNSLRNRISALPMENSLTDLLDARANELGDTVLAEFFQDDTRLTYSALSEASKRLASSLERIGVRKGTHVAVCMENCYQFVIAWFAIARIGAVMVPVNFRFKAKEMKSTLVDSDSQFLFVDTQTQKVFEEIEQLPALLLEGGVISFEPDQSLGYHVFADLVANGDTRYTPPVRVRKTDLFAIQYTSGSTGQPKGCMLTHEYWLTIALVAGNQRSGSKCPDIKNVLVTYPLFYMQAQIEFLMALQNGGTAFVARSPSRRMFMDWVRRYSIHYCAMNPMVYNGLPLKSDDGDNDLKYIGAYYHRGDVLRALENRFKAVGRDSFGMTEAGSVCNVPISATHMLDFGTCGLPSTFREVRVCDPDGNEVSIGDPGELCIAGNGIFLGYYKRPKENRNGFHHGRWFRSGDLARVDENGYVYIIGRIKEMIKRNGENISALEIEQVLRTCSGLREVAVVAVPDPSRMEEVRAIISLKDGQSKEDITPDVLRDHCAAQLEDFKIPRYFSYIDKFPRTGSQKIDKVRLVIDSSELNCQTYDHVTSDWCDL